MAFLTALLVIAAALSIVAPASGYRIGDSVGILLRTHTASRGGGTVEAYRQQLPRFGVSTTTRFDVASLVEAEDVRMSDDAHARRKTNEAETSPGDHLRLSLSFDEGFHRIPWIEVYDASRRHAKALERLEITLVYSGSDGSIHAVQSATKYRAGGVGDDGDAPPKSFTVEYIWVNEADVDARGALLALFLAVLVASLGGIVGACCHPERGRERRHDAATSAASGGAKYL